MLGSVRGSEAQIEIVLRGPTGIELKLQAQVDTGFSEFLTLPRDLIEALDLEFETMMPMAMADERTEEVAVHKGVIVWHENEQMVPVHRLDSALVGMALLSGSRLIVDIMEGGQVSIEPLP